MRATPVLLAVVCAGVAAAAPAAAFVMGTSQDADTPGGQLQRRIYGEAFRRLEMPLRFAVMPLQRLSAAVDQGQIDGDAARVWGYAEAHPELVRVEEPVYDVIWSLYGLASQPSVPNGPGAMATLAQRGWRASYLRGVAVCENALRGQWPRDALLDVSTDEQGFGLLRAGRSELHCTADVSPALLARAGVTPAAPVHRVLDIGQFPLFAFLHRRHAELAAPLAQALRQMRREGLIDRWREDILGELRR